MPSNTSLQDQIAVASETISHTAAPTSESPATAILSIADELVDRECRKNNPTIYTLPESTDQANDKTNFAELCKTVFDITAKATKAVRLGKKLENKNRLLLIGLDNQQDTVNIISHAAYLRQYQYDNI